MSILVDTNTPPVAVQFGMHPDDENLVNTVYVKAKLPLGDTIAIEEGSYRVEMTPDGESGVKVPVSQTGRMVVTMKYAVVSWEGPLFAGIKLSSGIWNRLDTGECMWWISQVYDKVQELNKARTQAPQPAATTNGQIFTAPEPGPVVVEMGVIPSQ